MKDGRCTDLQCLIELSCHKTLRCIKLGVDHILLTISSDIEQNEAKSIEGREIITKRWCTVLDLSVDYDHRRAPLPFIYDHELCCSLTRAVRKPEKITSIELCLWIVYTLTLCTSPLCHRTAPLCLSTVTSTTSTDTFCTQHGLMSLHQEGTLSPTWLAHLDGAILCRDH